MRQDAKMTPKELKAARYQLGLTQRGLAEFVRVATGRTVRKWEDGERDIPGPVEVLIEACLANAAVRRHFGLTLGAPATTTESE